MMSSFSPVSVDLDPNNRTSASHTTRIKYPVANRTEVVHKKQGFEVPNPYEYLENPNREETQRFVEEQNALFSSTFSQTQFRSVIYKTLKQEWNYTNVGVPMRKGMRMFFWENSGNQNHNVLYVNESTDGRGHTRKILDPNLWDKDGTISVGSIEISRDGKMIAYTVSENGSDWASIKVRDVDCGHDLEDVVRFTKLCNIQWTKDSRGFFYQRFPKPLNGQAATGTDTSAMRNAKLYYHEVNTLQDDDVLVVDFESNPTWNMFIEMSDDGDYLFVQASDIIGEKYLFYTYLNERITGKLRLTRLFSAPGNHWYLANDGTIHYFMTTVGAKNYHQVVRVDLANSASGKGKYDTVVQDQGKKIHFAIVVNQNKLVICYIKDVLSQMEIRDLFSGHVIDQVRLEPGTVTGRYGRRSDNDFHFKIESYINPGTIYKVQFLKNEIKMEVHKASSIASLDLSMFKMSMFSYSSNDGTNIPVFLVHRKDMVRDSNRPCLLTAYGGYGVSTLPGFNLPYLFFAQHFNGVVAIANIRGGGEYGKNWWNEGRLLNKKTGFDDFIFGAKFLLNNGYTRSAKLAITGASNGGLLVGAVVNERPELFGAAIPRVGIMDMLRYHLFTVGHLWIGEFGSPDDPKYFEFLKKYSPLHNIRIPEDGQQYPAMLVTTSSHDDRVVCSHSLKYIAELQYMATKNPAQTNPLVMKVYQNSGHIAGKSRKTKIEEWTDMLTFLQQTLDYSYN